MNKFAQALASALDLCIATKTITENGEAVGFMYREAAVFPQDSGWRFFSGNESDEYTDNPDHFQVQPVGNIIQTNPAIATLIHQTAGTAWELNQQGEFQPVTDWQPQD